MRAPLGGQHVTDGGSEPLRQHLLVIKLAVLTTGSRKVKQIDESERSPKPN